jgi:hypothetical protein
MTLTATVADAIGGRGIGIDADTQVTQSQPSEGAARSDGARTGSQISEHALLRVAADLLRRAIDDTWSKNETRRCGAWDFLGSGAARVLFATCGFEQGEAVSAIASQESRPRGVFDLSVF